jgi:hypothetical protein
MATTASTTTTAATVPPQTNVSNGCESSKCEANDQTSFRPSLEPALTLKAIANSVNDGGKFFSSINDLLEWNKKSKKTLNKYQKRLKYLYVLIVGTFLIWGCIKGLEGPIQSAQENKFPILTGLISLVIVYVYFFVDY